MKLTKFEQSGFIIQSDSGYRLAIDIGAYTPVEKLEDVRVEAVLVSHIHGDHFSVPQIKALAPEKLYLNEECIEILGEEKMESDIIQVRVGDSISIDTMEVTIFDVDHGPNVSVRPKENFGFLIECDGQKIYFAGDMFYSSGIDVSDLEVDVAFIPVGGFYTFDPQGAFEFVKQFKKIGKIVPMHYEKTQETCSQFTDLVTDGGFSVDTLL